MELQLYKQNGLASIPNTEVEVWRALNTKIIKEIHPAVLFEVFKSAITKAYAMVRFENPVGKEFTLMIDQVMQICQSKFGTLREDEVMIAISRGVLKEYGDYMGLSIVSFVNFVKKYMEQDARNQMLAEINKPIEIKPPPSPKDQKEAFLTRLEILFESFKAGKQIMPTEATFYFDKLFTAKVIRMSEDKKRDLKQKAFLTIKTTKNPANAKSKVERDSLKNIYNKFTKNGLDSSEVRNEAMHLGLLEWFQNLKDFDLAIRDEIL